MANKKSSSSLTSKVTAMDNTTTKDLETASISKKSRKAQNICQTPPSSSHTQFVRANRHTHVYERITTDEYFGKSESLSRSGGSFGCEKGPTGKVYTAKGLLKRNLVKVLDPVAIDPEYTKKCPQNISWDTIKTTEFLMKDPVGRELTERLKSHLKECIIISSKGFKIDTLDSLCVILDFLVESLNKKPMYREDLELLLKNLQNPILLNVYSDVVTYFDTIRNFIEFLGYLLIRLEDDDLFNLVSKALLYQLTASDEVRGPGTAHQRFIMEASKTVLSVTAARMLGLAKAERFLDYVRLAFVLACDSVENCIDLMMENILETIFYRFNPYFPNRDLPKYDIGPVNVQDINIKLGQSTIHIAEILSLLLVLVKTIKPFLEENPQYRDIFPHPDNYSQRCFVWAYRYECRAATSQHRHQRNTLTMFVNVLLYIFRDKLIEFANVLMPDVLSLSVWSELPLRDDWTRYVTLNTSLEDVHFKKMLIRLSVDFLRFYPYNAYMAESRHWIVGLMYLIDPGLCTLRCKWSKVLYSEIRITVLQALVLSFHLIHPKMAIQCSLIRRILWYIEWFTESPYGFSTLYWCVRLIQICLFKRGTSDRKFAVRELTDTHGVIILMHLCTTLLAQKTPPVLKSQMILSLVLQLLASTLEDKSKVVCCVYPHIKWPGYVNKLVKNIMDTILQSLDKNNIICDSWTITTLNFIWQAIIWNDDYRPIFIANNGIYQLLDLIAVSRYPVHCVALSVIIDALRSGDAVSQLITWRANIGASNAYPNLVKQGSTIATLLAAIVRRDCIAEGVTINEEDVLQEREFYLNGRELESADECEQTKTRITTDDSIQEPTPPLLLPILETCKSSKDLNLEFPMMTAEYRKYTQTPADHRTRDTRTINCEVIANMSACRTSKCYAILYLLSEDLKSKVDLADEAYNLYKHCKILPTDECSLVICSHYLTMKINETWLETAAESCGYVDEDQEILEEFLHIGKSMGKFIQKQQLDILQRRDFGEHEQEYTLYSFLGRLRLNIALDALRELRCIARSADRNRIAHAMLFEAVHAFHRRSVAIKKLNAPVIRTYGATLDEGNVIGQNKKVISIDTKNKPQSRQAYSLSSEECGGSEGGEENCQI